MDSTILKYHKLSDLPVSRALNQVSRTYLENWFALGDDEYYVNLALGFLRGLNTAIRGQEAPNSTQRESFPWQQMKEDMRAPRIDKLELKAKNSIRVNPKRYEVYVDVCLLTVYYCFQS